MTLVPRLLFAHDSSGAGAVRFGFALGLALIVVVLFGVSRLPAVRVASLFVGEDHRVSTSKTIAAVWTIVVAAALASAVYANLLDHPAALNAMNTSGIVGQYAVLFGGPLGAAILAKQIVMSQVAGGTPKTAKTAGPASPIELITDDTGNSDLGDLQYVLFNLVALFFVISTFLHDPTHGLPHVPDVLLGLTSVSAAGYLGKKALAPSATPGATIAPAKGPAGTPVQIQLAGLIAQGPTLFTWVQFGNSDSGQSIQKADVEQGTATVKLDSPDIGVDPDTKVSVSVITEDGAVLPAGSYTYATT
jgi:hypothetical protein